MPRWFDDEHFLKNFERELSAFEGLDYSISDGKAVVEGTWPVFGKDHLITRFQIKIIFPDNYPNEVPTVFETGGRIPNIPDRHVNTSDASACLFTPPQRYEKWPPGSGLREFLNGPVKEYFFSQAFYELEKRWPFNEWSHGDEGVAEYFALKFRVFRTTVISELIQLALEDTVPRQRKCPCNSGKRFKDCHQTEVKKLNEDFPQIEILNWLEALKSLVRKNVSVVKDRS